VVKISMRWWSGSCQVTLRTTANLSEIFAWSGSNSLSSIPATLVRIGRNSPRISAGASGFMS
jgi:hypothetical protein